MIFKNTFVFNNKNLLIALIFFITVCYFFMQTELYRMTELDHLMDRIRFGRLVFHNKANLTVGKIQIHNRDKVLTINFNGQKVFAGQMEPFLILMQAKGSIQNNKKGFFRMTDSILKTCKIQRVLSLYSNEEQVSIELHGGFQDCPDANYKVKLNQIDENKLNITVETSQIYQRVYLFFNHSEDSDYYGLGEQFSYLNLGKNKAYSTLTRSKGTGRGDQPLTFLTNLLYGNGGSYYTSEAPSPIWLSSKKIAYILNSHNYMAWIDNKVLVWGNNFTFTYIKESSYKNLVKQISLINGYTSPIPEWANQGAILGLQGGTKSVLNKLLKLKEQGAKVSGIWVQDWVSKRHQPGHSAVGRNQLLDQEQYGDWGLFAKQMKNESLEILIFISPMLLNPITKSKIRKISEKTSQEIDNFTKLQDSQTLQTRSESNFEDFLIDFQKPEVVKDFKSFVKQALKETGAKGMMVDSSEVLPAQGPDGSIEQGVIIHNRFSNLFLDSINQIINQIQGPGRKFCLFSKAGHLHSPKYTQSLWTGDQVMNFNFHNGLPSCLTAILSSGLVGYSNTHCAIGGQAHVLSTLLSFTKRSQLLLLRQMQLAAFTSAFRTHDGNSDDKTLQVYSNEFLIRSFSFYSSIYQILSGYRKQQAKKSQQQRIPLVRPLFLELEGVKGTENIQDQFFLGSQIYVAPMLDETSQRKYFLPKGEWKDLWNGKVFKGCDCLRIWKENLPIALIRTSSPFANDILSRVKGLIKQYEDVVFRISEIRQEEL